MEFIAIFAVAYLIGSLVRFGFDIGRSISK